MNLEDEADSIFHVAERSKCYVPFHVPSIPTALPNPINVFPAEVSFGQQREESFVKKSGPTVARVRPSSDEPSDLLIGGGVLVILTTRVALRELFKGLLRREREDSFLLCCRFVATGFLEM